MVGIETRTGPALDSTSIIRVLVKINEKCRLGAAKALMHESLEEHLKEKRNILAK